MGIWCITQWDADGDKMINSFHTLKERLFYPDVVEGRRLLSNWSDVGEQRYNIQLVSSQVLPLPDSMHNCHNTHTPIREENWNFRNGKLDEIGVVVTIIEMFYLNTIEQLFLSVEQLDQLEVCLPYSRLLAGIPILAVFQNLRWNSNKTSLGLICLRIRVN